MEKHRWQKAELKLRKSLSKDTLNPSGRYLLSVFYFHRDNPAFNLDSAYYYAVSALNDYGMTHGRLREKLQRMAVDSIALIHLRAKIDSTAFEEARMANTEAAYLEFLTHFPSSLQRELAAELRDEVAYQEALRENTYQAFLRFLTRYPEAKRASEARDHYDRLLYHSYTSDGRLASFEKFLADHPNTPYRPEINEHIFQLSTANGTVNSFLEYMARYPGSEQVAKAAQITFHMLAEQDNPQWPSGFLNDSLRSLLALKDSYLVPVLRKNLYGFINEKGVEVMAPTFKNIHPDYLCGHITDEILILDHQLVARNGSIIYDGAIEEVSDLGSGFLKVTASGHIKVIHKAGFVVFDSVEDSRILGRQYLTVKKANEWFLYTFTGRLLDHGGWDDISAFGNIFLFQKSNKVFIASKKQFLNFSGGTFLKLSEAYEEARPWTYDRLWVKSGKLQGVLNESLEEVIRMDNHQLTETFFGAIARHSAGFSLYDQAGQEASTFEDVHVHKPWARVKKGQSWFLFDPRFQQIESIAYDTLRAEGPFMVGMRTDTAYVHFPGNRTRRFDNPSRVMFLPGMDSTSFLLVEESPAQKSVFDLRGKKLFSTAFDAIEYAGRGIFVVTIKEKKGLLNSAGEKLLPADFDAIGSVQQDVVSLLKKRKFGAYHISSRQLIIPQYDRNVLPYSEEVVSIFKDGFYAFLKWNNKTLSRFEFDEIRYWADTVALVRKGSYWNFYNIASQETIEGNLRNVMMVKNSPQEKIAIIQKGMNYGVINSRGEILVPISFSDIVNVGSADEPLYFTEKHIEEASLFIIIYYDHSGRMLRKEIYDDPADYDRIYCSEN